MPKYCKSPIKAEATGLAAFARVEIELFLEKLDTYDSFDSLGVWTVRTDADGAFSKRIETVYEAAMIDAVIADFYTPEGVIRSMARQFWWQYRVFEDGEWGSWIDSSIDTVIYGGFALRQIESTDLISPFILHKGDPNLSDFTANSNPVYVFFNEAGTYNVETVYNNLDGSFNSTDSFTLEVARAETVYRIEIQRPNDNTLSGFYDFTISNLDSGGGGQLFFNWDYQYVYKINYLSGFGGYSALPCAASMSKTVEVSPQVSDNGNIDDRYSETRIGESKVYKVNAQHKFRVSTGFLPSYLIESAIQDFMLSPVKFYFYQNIARWIPIKVNTKSVEYYDDYKNNLRSYTFEFEPLYKFDLPIEL